MAKLEDLEYINCPFCGSNNFKIYLRSKDYLFSQRDFTIVACNACGLRFTNPRVKVDQISHYYFLDYGSYKIDKRPQFFQKIMQKFNYIIGDTYQELLAKLRSVKAKTVLEIGPGAGSLLYYLKGHGFEVTGVELDINCVEKLRGKNITCYWGDLNNIKDKIGYKKFDAVILCHAFEHLYQPQQTLQNINELLNEDGIIYFALPNIDSCEAKIFKKYWRGLDLPRHVFHYDINTIKALLAEKGFSIVKSGNQFFPSSFVESIGFYIFKGRGIPSFLYYLLYYLWRLLSPIHHRLIGSGMLKIFARKV